MSKPNKKAHEIKAVILLDACMSSLDRCRSGCEDDINIQCIHRFKGKVKVIACNGFGSFMRLSDSQVVLYLLWSLMKQEFFKSLSRDCRFFIVTRDKMFHHQVQREWDRKRNGKTVPVMFFNDNEIKVWFKNRKSKAKAKGSELREVVIEIITIHDNRAPGSSEEEVGAIINQINELVFKS